VKRGEYSFRYSFNVPQAEWMSINPGVSTKGYTWAFKETLGSSGEDFDQYVAYFMHTFWIKQSKTFARWFEWSFSI